MSRSRRNRRRGRSDAVAVAESGHRPDHAAILGLQRTVGNRAVAQVIQRDAISAHGPVRVTSGFAGTHLAATKADAEKVALARPDTSEGRGMVNTVVKGTTKDVATAVETADWSTMYSKGSYWVTPVALPYWQLSVLVGSSSNRIGNVTEVTKGTVHVKGYWNDKRGRGRSEGYTVTGVWSTG